MKMYRCEECGHLFEEGEEARWVETHGFEDGRGEQWTGCPVCKGGFEEIKPCKICESYEHDSSEVYCDECKRDVLKRFTILMNENFTQEERDLLNDLLEGERI